MSEDIRIKLASIPEALPEAEDIFALEDARPINDGSLVPLNVFKESLEGYNGKVLLRIPKSLHKKLIEEAQIEGVSLNQYALYKLSR